MAAAKPPKAAAPAAPAPFNSGMSGDAQIDNDPYLNPNHPLWPSEIEWASRHMTQREWHAIFGPVMMKGSGSDRAAPPD